jgi:hypothetical protein
MDRKKCDIVIKVIDDKFKWNTLKIRGNIIIKEFDNVSDVVDFYCQLAAEIRSVYKFKLVIIIGISLVEEKNGN